MSETEKHEHPIKKIALVIGLGIGLIIVVNLGTFGEILQLSTAIVGCSHDCTKIQWLGTAVIDIVISLIVGIIVVLFERDR